MTLLPHEQLIVTPDVGSAARAGAERVVEILTGTVSREPSVALAGGKTPAAMYRLLTLPPFRTAVDWRRVQWFWGDERCVPPDHADSNYRMARETLLDPLEIDAARIHRMPADAADLSAAAREHEQTVRTVVREQENGIPSFDLVLLGIGADGHTASLFPGSDGLAEHERLVVAHYCPAPAAMRMTFTYPLLWAARHVVFLVCGPDKAEPMQQILSTVAPSSTPFGPQALASVHFEPPAAGIRFGHARVTWILDEAAAARIQK